MEVSERAKPSFRGDDGRQPPSSRAVHARPSPGSRGALRVVPHVRYDQPEPRYQPLVAVALVTAVGLVLDRYGGWTLTASSGARWSGSAAWPRFAVWSTLAAASLLIWWLSWRRRRDCIAAWVLLAAVGFAGAAWHHLCWDMFRVDEIGRFATPRNTAPSCVEVTALEAPARLSAPQATPLRAIPVVEKSRLWVALTAIRDGTRWRSAAGACQLTVDGHLLGVRCGDRLRVFGQLIGPHPPLNPGEFDFAAHARADRQLAQLRCSSPDCISIRARGSRWTAASLVDSVRVSAKRLLHRMVGPQQAELAAAILLGAREGLTNETTEPYLVTGTIHVLVVSGMNVAILAAGLLPLLHFGCLPRRAGLALIMTAVVVYALVTRCQPPAVRAAVLGVLMCMAAWTGRRGAGLNSLAASAVCVLAINPADLFRVGPQLSFLAVATLMWVGGSRLAQRFIGRPGDALQKLVESTQPWHSRIVPAAAQGVGWLLLTSLAVWLVTLPLVLASFHVASPISILISPLVWPLAFAAMWAGFVVLVLGWLMPPIGLLCGGICSVSLGGLERVVAWAETFPGGHVWLPGPATWWIIGFYAGLIAVLIGGRRLPPVRWQVAVLSLWILAGLVPSVLRVVGRDSLTCSFIAVGHGTCVVLETPTGETLLYDAGAMGSPAATTQTIACYLWHRGIMRLDGIVVSHADVDHYNAVPGLLERFHVGAVYVSPVMFQDKFESSGDGGRELLRAAIRSHSVPLHEIHAGDKLRIGPHLQIDVLHPRRKGVIGSNNANSVTLAVEYDTRRVLLPGDLESPGIDDVMAESPYDCDIVLAPHHGSRTSDPPGFAAWCTPEWVVISGGDSADTSTVVRAYQSVGATALQTQMRGTVAFAVQSHAIRARSFLGVLPLGK